MFDSMKFPGYSQVHSKMQQHVTQINQRELPCCNRDITPAMHAELTTSGPNNNDSQRCDRILSNSAHLEFLLLSPDFGGISFFFCTEKPEKRRQMSTGESSKKAVEMVPQSCMTTSRTNAKHCAGQPRLPELLLSCVFSGCTS